MTIRPKDLLEILPEYQNQGIGSALMEKMKESLNHLYMVDLACDPDKTSYYEKLGFRSSVNMSIRNYDRQNGEV